MHEDPRVTKPYSDAQWAAIRDLGRQVDEDLAKHDVRLTQGGEPTFVSVDDMEGPEWNYTALSPKKRELAETLLRRLATRFALRRLSARGPGQMVSGRAASALGARRLVARGRAAAVARRDADGRYACTRQCRSRGRPTLHYRNRRATRPRRILRDHRVRGRAEAACDRGGASRQRGPAAGRSREDRRACPSRPAPAAGARSTGRVRAAVTRAATPRANDAHRVAQQPLAVETRTPLSAAGRFAARPPVAAGIAAGRPARG